MSRSRSDCFTPCDGAAQGAAHGVVRATGKGRHFAGVVQPADNRLDGKVGRLKAAPLLALSNRPTSSSRFPLAYMCGRAYACASAPQCRRLVASQVFVFPLDKVRQLDEASSSNGFSRPTFSSNHEMRG